MFGGDFCKDSHGGRPLYSYIHEFRFKLHTGDHTGTDRETLPNRFVRDSSRHMSRSKSIKWNFQTDCCKKLSYQNPRLGCRSGSSLIKHGRDSIATFSACQKQAGKTNLRTRSVSHFSPPFFAAKTSEGLFSPFRGLFYDLQTALRGQGENKEESSMVGGFSLV